MQAGRVGEKETSKYNRNGLAAALLKYRRFKTMISKNGNNEIKTLSHSTYRCQYHIVLPIVISITQGFTSILKAKS